MYSMLYFENKIQVMCIEVFLLNERIIEDN